MAGIRSLLELTPEELKSRPAVRNFGPFRDQVIRSSTRSTWNNWWGREYFWMGRAIDSAHTLLVGPFRTKRGAANVWKDVPPWDKNGPNGEITQDFWGRPVTRALQTGTRFPK